MRDPISTLHKDEEHTGQQAPGGASVNHAATVATSALLGGATAGALAGAVAGPVGAAVGAAIGAVAAGFAGHSIAESVDASAEEAHWRENYRDRPYVTADDAFDDYGPAYGYGVNGFVRHAGRTFDDVEPELSREWGTSRGASSLDWDRARPATRDAWDRVSNAVERAVPGDSDRDRR